ncbi:ANTAR domain-containing protein [Candidatus Poribacteria bacterium]|nr:ANTAR domain-containing protein [Candidatus Poribacteria bacterium]
MEAVDETQNVLIVDNDLERTHLLNQVFEGSRYNIVAHVGHEHGLLNQVKQTSPDIILIGVASPSEETLIEIGSINQNHPCPIVMFAQDDRSETIQNATLAGVSAYVVGILSKERIETIIEAAIARFGKFRALQKELEKTKTSLAERKIIERAKEIVAQQRGTTEAEAYQTLRKMAMDRRKRLAEIAQDVLSIAEVLTNKA